MSFAVLGDEFTVLAYSFAGVVGNVCDTKQAAKAHFSKLSNCKVLLLTKAVAQMLSDEVETHRKSALPPLITVIDSVLEKESEFSLESLIYESLGLKFPEEKGAKKLESN